MRYTPVELRRMAGRDVFVSVVLLTGATLFSLPGCAVFGVGTLASATAHWWLARTGSYEGLGEWLATFRGLLAGAALLIVTGAVWAIVDVLSRSA